MASCREQSVCLVETHTHTIDRAVNGHFDHPHGRSWTNLDQSLTKGLSQLVGECIFPWKQTRPY